MPKLPDPTKPSTRGTEDKGARVARNLDMGIEDPTKISTSSTPQPASDEMGVQTEERKAENP